MNELNGNWQKISQGMNDLGDEVSRNLKLATAQNAELVRAGLVKHIQSQDLQWEKLNKKYLSQKKKKGLSTAILIATSQLMQSITTKLGSDKLSAFIGVLRSGKRKDGENPVLVAEVHEFGSKKRKIPARPLFRPTFKETQDEMVERYKNLLRKSLESIRQ